MRVSDVQALTGNEHCERFLADLARRNYFTYRLSPRERVYEYHPLFREFLLARLRQTHTSVQLRRLQSDARGCSMSPDWRKTRQICGVRPPIGKR